MTVVGALLCAPVTWFVGWLFTSRPLARFALPSTTAGYSGVLTAITFAVTFLKPSTASWLYAVLGAAITAVVTW